MRTYGTLTLRGDMWIVDKLEPHVAIRLKHIFPRIPKASRGPFKFPNDMTHASDLKWFTDRYPLAVSEADQAMLEGGRLLFSDRQAEMERILLPDYTPPKYAGVRDGKDARLYQKQAIEVLSRSAGLLLGDDVGLGKTYATAWGLLAPDALPGIVVCWPHLQTQWKSVIESFTTLRAHAIKKTRPYDLPRADVYVFRYTQLVGWADVLEKMNPGLVAWDEIQELRTGTSAGKGVAALRLASAARMRLGLSATPIYNYGTEFWNILQYINRDVLGDYHDFLREWAPGGGKIADPKALGTFLREQHCFLRRSKSDVGQEMPAVNKIVETVDYDQETVKSVEELAHALAVKATTGTFIERGMATRELDMLARQITGVSKARQVAQFARMIVEGGEPVVLVGWHREVYDIWNAELADLKPAMYTGSESAAGKEREKDRFLAGETDVLILSLRSGAGLDGLQFRCSTMVFGELDWSPGVHHQCIGRLDRDGQKNPVTAFFLVVEEGSDPPVMEVLGIKASEASSIVDPHLGVQSSHTDVSHLKTLVERYLNKRGRRADAPAIKAPAPSEPEQAELFDQKAVAR